MKKKIFKQKKGVTMMDVAVALIVLTIFAGTIGRLYYMIAYNNAMIRLNAIATYYVVIVAEDMDRIGYDKVESKTNDELKVDLEERYTARNENFEAWPDNLNITLTVENYDDGNSQKVDIVKKVNIVAKYKVFNNEEEAYAINTLKIKER